MCLNITWTDPEGVLNKVLYGEAPPEVQPLTLLYTVLAEKVPLLYTFIEKRYPFNIPTLEHCTPFLSPCNEANEQYYGTISSITRRNVYQTSVIYSVHVLGGSQDTPDIRRANSDCFRLRPL